MFTARSTNTIRRLSSLLCNHSDSLRACFHDRNSLVKVSSFTITNNKPIKDKAFQENTKKHDSGVSTKDPKQSQQPESINFKEEKMLISELQNSRSVELILQIYLKNQEKFNLTNTVFVLRNINNRFHTFYRENIESFKKNVGIQQLLNYIITNLPQFNEYTIVELVTFYRKLQNYQISFPEFEKKFKDILKIVDNFIGENKINAKLLSQIFYEYALLNINTSHIFNALKTMINDPNHQVYFTTFSLTTIIKTCFILSKKDKKRYLDFCYQCANMLEPHVPSLNIHSQCSLFNHLLSLRLHLETSHRKFPHIIIKLKESISTKLESLKEDDYLNIMQGYESSPNILDIKLLLTLKSSTLYTIYEKPFNLSTDFLISYVRTMSNQREGIPLDVASLEKIAQELTKRFQTSKVKLKTLESCLDSFKQADHFPKFLIENLYKKVMETPSNELTLQICMEIGTHFCHINQNIGPFLQTIYDQFQSTLHQRHIEPLIKFLYLLSHPNYESDPKLQEASKHVFETINDKLSKYPAETTNALRTLGSNYSHLTKNYFLKLHKWALELMGKEWDSYSDYQKFNFALSFISNRLPDNEWDKFFEEKLKDLTLHQLSLLISLYERTPRKNYYMVELIIKVLIDNAKKTDIRNHILKKLIDFILITPVMALLNRKGNPNQKLYVLLETLPTQLENLKEMNVSNTELIKLGRWLKQVGIEQDYPALVIFNQWENKDLASAVKEADFLWLELGEFIVEALEDPNSELKDQKGLELRMKTFAKAIYTELQKLMDQTKNSEKSFSWIIKFAKMYSKVGEFFPGLRDKTYIGFLCDLLQDRMKEMAMETMQANILNSIFFIFEQYINEQIELDETNFSFLRGHLERLLDFVTPPSLMQQMKWLDNILSSGKRDVALLKLHKIFLILEKYYIECNIQKHSNIISQFLNVFVKGNTRNVLLYNKILKDIENSGDKIKPIYYVKILQSLAAAKINHRGIFKEFSQKILENKLVFNKETDEIIYLYARMGFNEPWAKNFVVKMLEHEGKIEKRKDQRPVQKLWTLLFYDLTEPKYVSGTLLAFSEVLREKKSGMIDLVNSYIADILNLLELQYKNTPHLQLGADIMEAGREMTAATPTLGKNIEEITRIMEKSGVKDAIFNHRISPGILANIYFPEKSLAIFYSNSYFVCFDKTSSTGSEIIRQRLFSYLPKDINYLVINEWQFSSLGSEDKKREYLISKHLI